MPAPSVHRFRVDRIFFAISSSWTQFQCVGCSRSESNEYIHNLEYILPLSPSIRCETHSNYVAYSRTCRRRRMDLNKKVFFSRIRGCCLESSLNFWRLHIQITRHAKAENERHMTCDTSGLVERCLSCRVCECDWLVYGFQVLNFNYTHRKKNAEEWQKSL